MNSKRDLGEAASQLQREHQVGSGLRDGISIDDALEEGIVTPADLQGPKTPAEVDEERRALGLDAPGPLSLLDMDPSRKPSSRTRIPAELVRLGRVKIEEIKADMEQRRASQKPSPRRNGDEPKVEIGARAIRRP